MNVIVLSDGDTDSDNDVAYIGSSSPRRVDVDVDPTSPVFVRASKSTAIEVIDVTDDERGGVSSDAPDFETVFGLRASPARRTRPHDEGEALDDDEEEVLLPSPPRPLQSSSTLLPPPRSPSTNTNALRATASESNVPRPKRSLNDILNDPSIFSYAAAAGDSDTESAVREASVSPRKKKSKGKKKEADGRKQADAENINVYDSDDGLTSEQRAKERERLKKKADKEAEKQAEREARKLARDTVKAAKEAEKSYQRKIADVNRLRKTKVEALCDVEIHMAHDLSLPSSPLAGALPEIKRRVEDSKSSIHFLSEEDTIVNGSIQFRRHVRADWNPVLKRYVPLEKERLEWETTTVLFVAADDIVDRVAQGGDALIEWIADVRLTLHVPLSQQLLLLIRGMNKYHAKTQSIVNRNFRETARAGLAGENVPALSAATVTGRVDRAQVEAELLRAQVVQRVFVVHVEKTEDVKEWVFNLAGDIALRPYKLLSKSHLPFSAPDVRKVAEPREALELMLQEVQGLTSSAASGISEEHPSFRAMMRAYEAAERRGGDPEGMLADCEIRTRQNGASCSRKVGKALSKRVFNLMRGEDALALM